MALDEIYDGYCIVCNHCGRYYRFDPRNLSVKTNGKNGAKRDNKAN